MPTIRYRAMPTGLVRAFQSGALDANSQAPERHVSDGDGVPCRHCLTEVAAGETYLILAYRPFPAPQPYAEVGPIFLCAAACDRHPDAATAPQMFLGWERLLLKGYGVNDRIVYGTGAVVPASDMDAYASELLARDDIAYVHARSARNNCYQVRIDRV